MIPFGVDDTVTMEKKASRNMIYNIQGLLPRGFCLDEKVYPSKIISLIYYDKNIFPP